MRRKIDVTAAEMLQLREQGMSNHDIAASLDISVATVRRYIGKQDGHMEGLSAFKNTPSRKELETEAMPVIQKYNPKPVLERYCIGCNLIELDGYARSVRITGDEGEILMTYGEIPDLIQFLAWAMRERMQAGESEEYAHGA
jgi:predicted transcriptional regulator